ncbi:MAG TPA: Lrp/AsnC family transcriptional regulator [Gaiellales bacterium]|jgi:Lrp/AsnC family transcriptional regulator for asnA, asnC and gidA|nr:Lrp/AsnC family transcriptional regulator [Gaiellales bacterium]
MRNEQLDELDRAIVGQLMEDGRRPYRVIARTLGVPESTVRFRATRLIRSGALHIVAMPDPMRLGYDILAMVLLRATPSALPAAIARLRGLPQVQYLSTATGRVNLLLQIVCKDTEDLQSLLAEIGKTEGILDAETVLEFEVHKFRYGYLAGG